MNKSEFKIEKCNVSAYKIPTATPEADGTINWDSTTLILVETFAGDKSGLGYTYTDSAAVNLIRNILCPAIIENDPFAIPQSWQKMIHAVRNIGKPGLAAMAISAVDNSLWDLKARLLDIPLLTLWGAAHYSTPVYGSGGFTSYTIDQLQEQLSQWVANGINRVKMKIGQHPQEDLNRVKAARAAIGPRAELFVDANGAYTIKQALEFAKRFSEFQVTWFEEPVPEHDFSGLQFIRRHAPFNMEIAGGEYGFDLKHFSQMLEMGSVDVLQADATRCLGYSGFFQVAAVCAAHNLDLSAHTAPQLHAHIAGAISNLRHIEYFFDHVRIESLLFDGVLEPKNGLISPDLSRPGNGLQFRRQDAEKFLVA
jgi:L-alanine-DL-glutamate epimerase-like enolase superfamily enzyme